MKTPKACSSVEDLLPSTRSTLVLLLVFAGLALTPATRADVTVLPETVTAVEMSNRDMNRIVCSQGLINDAFFSKEKAVTVTNVGSSSFVKFLIKHDGINPDAYASQRAEFYVVCGGDVYTLMATPKNIVAQTIWLSPGATDRIEKNIADYGPQVEEDRAVSLTMAVMQDDIPEAFRVSETAHEDLAWFADVIPDARIAHRRTVRVEGIGLSLNEYWIRPNHDLLLDEGLLLDVWFGRSIFAITFDTLQGRANRISRAFVVSRESR